MYEGQRHDDRDGPISIGPCPIRSYPPLSVFIRGKKLQPRADATSARIFAMTAA